MKKKLFKNENEYNFWSVDKQITVKRFIIFLKNIGAIIFFFSWSFADFCLVGNGKRKSPTLQKILMDCSYIASFESVSTLAAFP